MQTNAARPARASFQTNKPLFRCVLDHYLDNRHSRGMLPDPCVAATEYTVVDGNVAGESTRLSRVFIQ